MLLLYRVDSGRLGKVTRTPQGGWRVPATIAKVGIVEYPGPNGRMVREYNPPDVLQAALDSLRDAPVTNLHPRPSDSVRGEPLVFADNFKRLNVGTVSAQNLVFTDGEIRGELVFMDDGVAQSIERGREEVSAGYKAAVDYTPGTTPEGEPYDGIRTRIIFNHVAVVDTARAGSKVRLALDSVGTAFQTLEDPEVKFFVDGKEVPAEQVQSVLNALSAERTTLQAKVDAAEAQRDAAKSTADQTKVKLDAAEVQLADSVRLDAAVTARLELIENARKVLGAEYDARGKSANEIKSAVAAKSFPQVKLDGRGDVGIQALYEAALQAVVKDPDGTARLAGGNQVLPAPAPVVRTDSTEKTPRQKMLDELKTQGSGKLAYSRD